MVISSLLGSGTESGASSVNDTACGLRTEGVCQANAAALQGLEMRKIAHP
jgi:hypothetical protein